MTSSLLLLTAAVAVILMAIGFPDGLAALFAFGDAAHATAQSWMQEGAQLALSL